MTKHNLNHPSFKLIKVIPFIIIFNILKYAQNINDLMNCYIAKFNTKVKSLKQTMDQYVAGSYLEFVSYKMEHIDINMTIFMAEIVINDNFLIYISSHKIETEK